MNLVEDPLDSANNGMEDGRITKFFFNKLMNFEYSLLFFALSGLGFTIIYVKIILLLKKKELYPFFFIIKFISNI